MWVPKSNIYFQKQLFSFILLGFRTLTTSSIPNKAQNPSNTNCNTSLSKLIINGTRLQILGYLIMLYQICKFGQQKIKGPNFLTNLCPLSWMRELNGFLQHTTSLHRYLYSSFLMALKFVFVPALFIHSTCCYHYFPLILDLVLFPALRSTKLLSLYGIRENWWQNNNNCWEITSTPYKTLYSVVLQR